MGLDMYLNRKYYVKNWNHMEPDRLHKITIEKGGKPAGIPVDKICYVETEEIYWRKANQIHGWFVKNVQNGVDDCGNYYVSQDKLKELLGTINQVLASIKTKEGKVHTGTEFSGGNKRELYEPGEVIVNKDVAKELLPTAAGCFFGSTDYDSYYIEDLKFTKKELERILADPMQGGYFYYHSSW